MDATNALSASYNSAAVLTRQLQEVFQANAPVAVNTVLKVSTVNVDAQCPFFYIFAMGGQSTASEGPAFKTTFEFSNGGTPVTQVVVGWGNQASLNGGPDTFVSVLTTPNDGIGYFHDPVSQTCAAVNPGTLDLQGFIKRWTALCDTVRITTQLYGAAFDFTDTPFQYVHGVLQQPW